MKQFFGMSQRGNLDEALQGLYRPQFIMLLSNNDQFESHVALLEKRFPGIPSIGCIGMSYQTGVVENGVGVIAFLDGVTAVANVLEQASTMPIKYIQRLEQDMQALGGSSRDTVCIDFCSGNDACVLTTIYTVLRKRKPRTGQCELQIRHLCPAVSPKYIFQSVPPTVLLPYPMRKALISYRSVRGSAYKRASKRPQKLSIGSLPLKVCAPPSRLSTRASNVSSFAS